MKKPTLRFKAFDREWNECVLKEMASFSKGFGYSKNDLIDAGHPIVLYGRLYTKYQTVISDIDTFVDVKEGSVLSQGNEVVIPASGECAEDIARASVIADKNIILGGDLNIIKPDKSLDSVFLALSISHGSAHSKLVSQSQGATIAHLHNAEIQNVVVSYPSDKAEQKAIGSFFTELDSLIEGKRIKLDKLKTLKVAYLRKMFPKKGSRLPEIRFKGFSDDWDVRKLGSIANKITQKNTDGSIEETFTNSAEYGIISQREFFDRCISKAGKTNNYYVISPDVYVYNPRISSLAPVGPINRNKLNRTGVMSPLYTAFSVYGVDLLFLDIFFKTSCWHDFMFLNGDSGARSDRFSIKDEVFWKMPVLIPSPLEQQKIGAFFQNLDNLINLQQQELDKLTNIKSACLSKMFA